MKPIHFIAVSLLVGLMTSHISSKLDDKDVEFKEKVSGVIARALVTPLVCLAFAWIYWRLLS